MPLNDLRIPRQVLDSIRIHVERAVQRAQSGYSSAHEAEDTVTGALGQSLRTDGDQFVNVTEGQRPGTWRWSITYSKFGSGARESTESIVGADGILEIKVGAAEYDEQKSTLFQAKNTLRKDPNLVAQCAKMSVWREAAFVISYSEKGYLAYSIDDCLLARGSLAQATNGIPLAVWIVDIFIGCKNGHFELYYDKNERGLYWTREKNSENEKWSDRRVWVDFSPKHLIHIDVTPPNWKWSNSHEITPEKISLSRLTFDPIELFGLEPPFTLAALKKRRATLLRAYHSDNSYHLEPNLRSELDARIIEIIDTYSKLVALAVTKDGSSNAPVPKRKRASGLGEPKEQPIEHYMKKKARKRVRVRRS